MVSGNKRLHSRVSKKSFKIAETPEIVFGAPSAGEMGVYLRLPEMSNDLFCLFFVADGINSVGDYNSPPGGCRRRRRRVCVSPPFFHVSRLDNF